MLCEGTRNARNSERGGCGLDGKPIADSGITDGFGHRVPSGAAQYLSNIIIQELSIKFRSEKPGLLGRASMAHVSDVDKKEAYGVGKAAVNAALAGRTGAMIAIQASRTPEYKSHLIEVSLSKVANKEKKFPAKCMDGFSVNEDFFLYCRPLLGAALPSYAHLQ